MSRPTHSEFEDFFRLHGAIAAAEKEIKERGLKDKIKAWIREGNASPADLPYLCVIRTQNRKKSDWKGACARVLFRMFRSQPKVDAEMDKIDSGFETEPVENLCVEINHEYAAKA